MPARSSYVAAQHRDDEARSWNKMEPSEIEAVPPNRLSLAESSDDDVMKRDIDAVRTYYIHNTCSPPRGVGASINQYSTLPVSYL